MKKTVEITLRIDRKLDELLLEVEGEVEKVEYITALLGYMAELIKKAQQYGGKCVRSPKLKETKPNQISHVFEFPNATAKEQFRLELQKEK